MPTETIDVRELERLVERYEGRHGDVWFSELVAFLAPHAKAIVAALTELERVRGELQRLGRDYNTVREAHDDAVGRRGALEAERDAARAEIAKLKGAQGPAREILYRLLCDEDLTDEKLREFAERDAPRIHDALHQAEGYAASECFTEEPALRFLLDKAQLDLEKLREASDGFWSDWQAALVRAVAAETELQECAKAIRGIPPEGSKWSLLDVAESVIRLVYERDSLIEELRLANRGKEAELAEAVEETKLVEAAAEEIDRLRAALRDAKSYLLADEERRKLTGDALAAEAERDTALADLKRTRDALQRAEDAAADLDCGTPSGDKCRREGERCNACEMAARVAWLENELAERTDERDEAQSQVQALEDGVRDLKADLARERARLDWLEAHCRSGLGHQPMHGEPNSVVYSWVWRDGLAPGFDAALPAGRDGFRACPPLRTAIDAAMGPAHPQKSEGDGE